jgi:tetratricopeptide (TPR) repeat protein
LADEEKAFFRRLAVFRGSFALEAAEVLCRESGLAETDVLATIAALVDKSLLNSFESSEFQSRFTMLETIREFGQKQLVERGEATRVWAAYAAYYGQLAQEAEAGVWGATIAAWMSQLDLEIDNLRAALAYYLAHAEGAERSLQLAGSLWRFWEMRGYILEGRTWLDQALQRREEASPSGRWLALLGAGNLAVDQGDYAIGRQHYLESLHLLQTILPSLEDAEAIMRTREGIANNLINIGHIAIFQSDFAQAVAYTEEALALHRQMNNKVGMAISITNLAMIRLHQSQYDQAEQLSLESLALYQALGDERGIGWNLGWLGAIARERGDYARAAKLYKDCRLIYEKLSSQADLAPLYLDMGDLASQQGDDAQAEAHYQAGFTLAQALGGKKDLAMLLDRLSMIACQRRAYEQATTLSEQSLALHREIGNRFGLSESLHTLGRIAYAQQAYEIAAAHYTESLELKSQVGDQRGLVQLFKAFAALALTAQSQPERAARLLGAAEKLRRVIGIGAPPATRNEDETMIKVLRTSLGETAFAQAWVAGEAMELAQAIIYARGAESP